MTSETLQLVSEVRIPSAAARSEADWVRSHQHGVWRWLRFCGCPRELAEEVLQDALMAALHAGIDRDRSDTVAARWLRSTARNLFVSRLRELRRRPEAELLPEAETEAAWRAHARDRDGGDYVEALRTCLGRLDPRQRRVVQLRYGDGVSRAAIASELGMQEEGVKTLLRRLRMALRACVERKLEAR